MTVLVTGCSGFIGSFTCRKLITQGEKVIGIDSLNSVLYSSDLKASNTRELIRLSPNFDFQMLDLNQISSAFLKKHQVNKLIHFAALPGQLSSWTNFNEYLNANVLATHKLLDAVKSYGKIEKFVQISTSSVYGRFANSKESANLKPVSPYGITKLAAENLIRCYADITTLDYVVLRYFSVYGPGQRPDMAISQFLQRIVSGSEIIATGDGTQVRDLTYVEDVADATISALSSKASQKVYDVSGGKAYSINEIIKTCLKVTNSERAIKFVERPVGDQESTIGNRDAAVSDFGLKSSVSLEDGIFLQLESINRKILELGVYS
jgi:nucleoside-diphosphate-sugar epimerase